MKLHPSKSGRRSPKTPRGSSVKSLRSKSPSVRSLRGKSPGKLRGSESGKKSAAAAKDRGGKPTKRAFSLKRLKSGRSRRFGGGGGSDGSASQTAAATSEIIYEQAADEKDEERSAADEARARANEEEEREQPVEDERERPSGEHLAAEEAAAEAPEATEEGEEGDEGEEGEEGEEAEEGVAETNQDAAAAEEEDEDACVSFPNTSRTRSGLSASTKGSSKGGGGSTKCSTQGGSTMDPFLRDCEYSIKSAPDPTLTNRGLCALSKRSIRDSCSIKESYVSLQQRLKDKGELLVLEDSKSIRPEDRVASASSAAACRSPGGCLGELCSPLERDVSRDWRGEDDTFADPNDPAFAMVLRRSQGTLGTKDETVDTMEMLLSPRFVDASPDGRNCSRPPLPMTSLGLGDLLKLPIQKWDELRDEIAALAWLARPADEGTVRSNPVATNLPSLPKELQKGDSYDREAAMLFAKLAPASSFPPATNEQAIRSAAARSKMVEELLEELARERAAKAEKMAQSESDEVTARGKDAAWEREVEEARRGRERAEMQLDAKMEELKWMEANLKSETMQNKDLNKQLAQLKQDIIAAAKKQSMDQARALAAEEAQVAKEELIESLEEALDTKRRLVATAEKVIEETRANLVSVQQQCNEEAKAAKALQDELEAAHAKLAKAIETQQEGPTGKEIETLRAQADGLAAQLREANERASESERRLRRHEALEKCASRDLVRSETDVQEQEKELFSLRVQFMGQAERLEAMHARCEAECERNEVLNARIRELNAKIFAARAGRGDEGGGKPRPEEADDGIGAQDKKVKMLEARLLAEAREKAALRSQIAALKKGVSAQRTSKPFGRIGSGLKMRRTGSGAASSLKSGGGGSRTSAATSPATLTKATGKKLTALASSNRRVKADKISQEAAAARKTHARRLTDQVSVTASMSVDVDGGMDVELEYNDDSWTATEGWSSSEYDSSSWTQEESLATTDSSAKMGRGTKSQAGWFHQMMAGAMGGGDEDEETLGTNETPSTYERSLSAREGSIRTREGSIRTREGSLVSTATESSAVSDRSRRRPPRPPASRFRRNSGNVNRATSDCYESSAENDDTTVEEDTTIGDATCGTRSVAVSAAESRGKKPSPVPETDRSVDESTLGAFVLDSMIEGKSSPNPTVEEEEGHGLMSSVMNWFGGGGGGGREGAAGNSDFSRESVGGGGALVVQ